MMRALATVSAAAAVAVLAAAPALAEEPPQALFDAVGDTEYGEYLASECTGCHRADGAQDGIPAIIGWDQESFRYVMHDYRVKVLENPTMQMIAGRLGDEEIAALSAYFESLAAE